MPIKLCPSVPHLPFAVKARVTESVQYLLLFYFNLERRVVRMKIYLQVAICTEKRHSTSVGGIFIHVLFCFVLQGEYFASLSRRPGVVQVKLNRFISAKTLHS